MFKKINEFGDRNPLWFSIIFVSVVFAATILGVALR